MTVRQARPTVTPGIAGKVRWRHGVPLPLLRISLSFVVLGTFGSLISACGEGGRGPVPKVRAGAFAKAVNLRDDDVRGMTRVDAGFEIKGGVPPFGSCTTDARNSDEVIAVSSPRFRRSRGQSPSRLRLDLPVLPVEGVRSLVYVMRQPGLASRDVAAVQSVSAPACVARQRVKEMSGQFVGREPYRAQITASPIRFPLTEIAGYGLRVRGTFAAAVFHQTQRPIFYEDTFGFAIGSAEIVLHADSALRPAPYAEEQRLLSLLYGRAKAQMLS